MPEDLEATPTSTSDLAHALSPIFDDKGLISCVVQDALSKQVLQFESMDKRAYERTIDTGLAHYFINHRRGIWRRYPRPVGRYLVKEIMLNEEKNCLLLLVDTSKNQNESGVISSNFHREFDWQD